MTKAERIGLTAERLHEVLHYDPDTGVWIWRISTGRRVRAGSRAGNKKKRHGWRIGIDGCYYPGARLAFLYVTGQWPPHLVDHIDRDPTNDRWSNLRAATLSQNRANSGLSRHNRSGVKGVYWYQRDRRWVVDIECEANFADDLEETGLAQAHSDLRRWRDRRRDRLLHRPTRRTANRHRASRGRRRCIWQVGRLSGARLVPWQLARSIGAA